MLLLFLGKMFLLKNKEALEDEILAESKKS
jgi:hypothetical protein